MLSFYCVLGSPLAPLSKMIARWSLCVCIVRISAKVSASAQKVLKMSISMNLQSCEVLQKSLLLTRLLGLEHACHVYETISATSFLVLKVSFLWVYITCGEHMKFSQPAKNLIGHRLRRSVCVIVSQHAYEAVVSCGAHFTRPFATSMYKRDRTR